MLAIGKYVRLHRQKSAARIDQIDAWQMVFQRDFLRAQMLFHGDRIVGAALDGGVVGDDHGLASLDSADAGDDTGGRRRRRRTSRRRPAPTIPGRDFPDRSVGGRARGPAVCRARCGACARSRVRPADSLDFSYANFCTCAVITSRLRLNSGLLGLIRDSIRSIATASSCHCLFADVSTAQLG